MWKRLPVCHTKQPTCFSRNKARRAVSDVGKARNPFNPAVSRRLHFKCIELPRRTSTSSAPDWARARALDHTAYGSLIVDPPNHPSILKQLRQMPANCNHCAQLNLTYDLITNFMAPPHSQLIKDSAAEHQSKLSSCINHRCTKPCGLPLPRSVSGNGHRPLLRGGSHDPRATRSQH